ncbi:swi five-dependent recombination repair protein Sfr1 [Gigaspora margarita]|uniref:Swi five-dependent recombination repair protein Sfr1 n=1 Tax=Gigaspora margarita TaxID=4874 RepID=A0A8H3X2L6_GIGMA|nr:swi five-dependent recombination repair protein Sfr1 [Gigaspora margarita]
MSNSEPAAKRLSLGAKTPRRSLSSVISETRAKLAETSGTSIFNTPLGKKKASRRLTKSFKSPINLVQKDPEIKAMIEKQHQLERDIENAKDNMRKIKLLLMYQEKNEDENNNILIKKWRRASQDAAEYLFEKMPKQSSFIEESGFSNSWNGNWGWEDYEQQQRYNDSDQDDENYCEQQDNVEPKGTMKYMLKKMGVDLDLIKWNEDEECFEE